MGFLEGNFRKLIIERARQLGFKAKAYSNPRGWSVGTLDDRKCVVWADNQRVAAIERCPNLAMLALARHGHLGGAERRSFDVDRQLLDRGNQHMAAIGFPPPGTAEKPPTRRAPQTRTA